jgi:hypothetical protein
MKSWISINKKGGKERCHQKGEGATSKKKRGRGLGSVWVGGMLKECPNGCHCGR